MDIGKRIYDLRYARKITAKELGEAVGVSQSYVSLLEHNRRRVNFEVLAAMVDAFGITLAEFFAGAEEGAPEERSCRAITPSISTGDLSMAKPFRRSPIPTVS